MPPKTLNLSDLKTILTAVVTVMEDFDDGDEEEEDSEPQGFVDLNEAGISFRSLCWKEGAEASAAQHGLAENNLMSTEHTKNMISFVLKHTEVGQRMVIDLIMLHLTSLESDETQAVTIVPEITPSKTEFDGECHGLNYLVAKYPKGHMDHMLWNPFGVLANKDHRSNIFKTFRIFEAKCLAGMDELEYHTVKVVLAAAALCDRDGLDCTRAALTDGKTWLFFTYRPVDSGGMYTHTPGIKLGENAKGLPLILGLLRDWINNAHTPESELKYFTVLD
ncbi:hypothetical protein BDP27DRAFT_1361011 [Rhodocollybia butyracea]|uniref:Uncharacterized protein n=1 Tax=Rhodocollybia butyracea TaxID=206335 RepID=A0A9P5UAV5_9AGAR|nr:hypothetical protein BDP27DRAFT_1361011 [Rhodocollybia butyracea]